MDNIKKKVGRPKKKIIKDETKDKPKEDKPIKSIIISFE
jgi:hypothetical protein